MNRLLITSLLVVMAPLAHAQGDDKAYCTQLSDYYRRYVQNANGRKIDVEAITAVDGCSKGNAAESIPVLERKLRDAKITPPGGGDFKP